MRYIADWSFPDLSRERLEQLSKDAQRDFGDPGYHMLASVSGDRIFGIFQAEKPEVVTNWCSQHGGAIQSIAPFEVEAELGSVKQQS